MITEPKAPLPKPPPRFRFASYIADSWLNLAESILVEEPRNLKAEQCHGSRPNKARLIQIGKFAATALTLPVSTRS